jgi:glycine oxidase
VKGDYASPIVVIAAGAWSPQLSPFLPIVPQRGQILAARGDGIGLRRTVMALDGSYVTPRVDGRLIIGATREFAGWESTLTVGGVAWLLQAGLTLIPALAAAPIVEIWTGFRPYTLDTLPVIGEGPVRGLFYATGHGPAGLAQAPGTAKLLTALICGETPPIPPEPYSPLRFLKGEPVSQAPSVR